MVSKLVGFIVVFWMSIWLSFSQSMGHSVAFFDEEVSPRVDVDGFGAYGSNVFDIETMKLFYQGGHFDNLLKEESLNRLTAKNLFGAEYGTSISYRMPSVKWLKDDGFYFSYEINGGAGLAFRSDLFQLAFVGNQQYVGDSAILSGTEFISYGYQKIGLGFNRSNKLKVGLSLLSFDNYSAGMVDRGVYFADANSDSLSLMLSGEWMSANKQALNSPAGFGIGVDFEINLPYEDNDSLDLPRLVLGVKNLGVFVSSKQMEVLEVDTLYNYKGIEMNSISDFGNDLFTRDALQDSLLPEPINMRKVRLLPFEFYFYSISDPNGKKMQLVYGMRYRFGVAMIPQIYMGGDWRPNEKTIITPYLQFGGYSYFKTGLSIRRKFGKFGLGLNFNNVPGFLTREAYQQSMSISMSYGIK